MLWRLWRNHRRAWQNIASNRRLRNNPPILIIFIMLQIKENIEKNEQFWYNSDIRKWLEITFSITWIPSCPSNSKHFIKGKQISQNRSNKPVNLILMFVHYCVGSLNQSLSIKEFQLKTCKKLSRNESTRDRIFHQLFCMWKKWYHQHHRNLWIFVLDFPLRKSFSIGSFDKCRSGFVFIRIVWNFF